MTQGRATVGGQQGTEVYALPSLDDLVARPEQAALLPLRALLDARRVAQKLVADLDHAVTLKTATPALPAAPGPSQDGQDRLLTLAEAGYYLGRTLRWMRRHGRELPGRVVLGPRSIGYQKLALERYVRQRAQQ
jgi:hypothetical protein